MIHRPPPTHKQRETHQSCVPHAAAAWAHPAPTRRARRGGIWERCLQLRHHPAVGVRARELRLFGDQRRCLERRTGLSVHHPRHLQQLLRLLQGHHAPAARQGAAQRHALLEAARDDAAAPRACAAAAHAVAACPQPEGARVGGWLKTDVTGVDVHVCPVCVFVVGVMGVQCL